MRRLHLIGIGAGHPDHITVQAVEALNDFDVLFVVTKDDDTEDLVEHRRQIVARHRDAGMYRTVELEDPPRPWREAEDYSAAVSRWRSERVAQWEGALRDGLSDGECGAFLVWGDPSLYESTLAVVAEIARRAIVELDYDVIPGISSVQALTAAHRIPLNRVGRPVQISPARLLSEGMPDGVDDVVVMLDAKMTFASIPAEDVEIFWGAFLGTHDEILIAGPLTRVADDIARVRTEAKQRKGWMFDTYLLRRTRP